MLSTIYMPWWAWGYLLIILVIFVLGLSVDENRSVNKIYSSSMSLFTICISVIGFFNEQVIGFLGLFIVPMVVLGIVWEFTRSIHETKLAQNMLDSDPELTQEEREFLINSAIAFNALIIVPGYVMGLVLCFNVLGATL